MNPTAIIQEIDHRAQPLPNGPWIMTQVWHELIFAHWPMKPEKLRSLIPPVFELDTFEGEAWVGIVPFRMSTVHPRGIPSVPGISAFPELNVRTYVKINNVPGVYFFSLEAGNPLAVALARSIFHLPYFNASMNCKHVGNTILYSSHRTHQGAPAADFSAYYRPTAPVQFADVNTLPAWLTERYYLYTTDRLQRTYRGDIHHRRWPLQAAEIEIGLDTLSRSHKLDLPDTAPLLHYSERQEVLIWPLRRIL